MRVAARPAIHYVRQCTDWVHELGIIPRMNSASVSTTANRLLAALPRRDARRVLSLCDPIKLSFADVLSEPGDRIRHVYFPAEGFVSLATPIDGRPSLEVGLIGNEGMLGVPLVLGIDISPLRALVRGSGTALRMDAASFQTELGRCLALRSSLNRYLYALMAQFAQTVACTRFHQLGERLARWLLMTQDRAHSNRFNLTHEFLAEMLGVRRVGVTKAAGVMQRVKLISYRRGHITILDRKGLEAVSCGCYRAMKNTYTDMLRHSSSSFLSRDL
jgi:CRP-like cAMP-binding protein